MRTMNTSINAIDYSATLAADRGLKLREALGLSTTSTDQYLIYSDALHDIAWPHGPIAFAILEGVEVSDNWLPCAAELAYRVGKRLPVPEHDPVSNIG